MTDTAKRLAAHPRFEWGRGMRETKGSRFTGYLDPTTGEESWSWDAAHPPHCMLIWPEHRDDFVPDLDDDATAGCLLAMLGAGWSIYHHVEGEWVVNTLLRDGPSHVAEHLGEACALALLECWGPP